MLILCTINANVSRDLEKTENSGKLIVWEVQPHVPTSFLGISFSARIQVDIWLLAPIPKVGKRMWASAGICETTKIIENSVRKI